MWEIVIGLRRRTFAMREDARPVRHGRRELPRHRGADHPPHPALVARGLSAIRAKPSEHGPAKKDVERPAEKQRTWCGRASARQRSLGCVRCW